MQIVPDYLPQEFGGLLLSLALILTLAPYLAGHDLGIFKIPDFSPTLKRKLKWIGPFSLIFAIFLHVPFGEKMCDEPIYEMVADEGLCGTEKEEYTVTPARPATCRHPDFGREGWSSTKTVKESSGWRSGGSSRGDWCNKLLARFLQARSISTYEHAVLDTDESSRKDWKGHVTYKYKCELKISWDPVYAERTDERCGILPAETAWREVAAQCQKQVGTKKVPCSTLDRTASIGVRATSVN